jgi:DnaD/phage-associated family protein
MNYKFNLGAWNSVFAVPSAVVDNYIKLAGGNNLKVLLYALRYSGEEIEVSKISSGTGVSADDVKDALLFWEQTELFSACSDEIIHAEPQKHEPAASTKKIELEREPRFVPKEIARAVRDDKGMNFLFKECERIFGRPLKHNEQNTLMVITEETGIPAECTLMLVEYCASCGKATPAYMKTIAVDWLERGIMSIGAVEAEIRILREINSLESKLKRLFEMSSAFSKVQKDLIRRWSSLGYSEEMLSEAYQITLNQTGKMAFPYMDKIIEKWNTEGIRSKEQLEKAQQSFKNTKQKSDDAKSSFDVEKIWQNIIEK